MPTECTHNPMTTMASRESMIYALSTIAGSDYNSISNLRLEFGPTRYLNLVRVPILNDDIHETLQESFSAILILDSPSLPRINIFPSQAKITIEDGNAVYMFVVCQVVVLFYIMYVCLIVSLTYLFL